MRKQDFFQGQRIIVQTAEYLRNLMTSLLPEAEDDYILGDVIICDSVNYGGVDSFPVVFLPLTDKERPEYTDFMVYVPGVDFLAVTVGNIHLNPMKPRDIGRKFVMTFSDGCAAGEIVLKNNEICIKYES